MYIEKKQSNIDAGILVYFPTTSLGSISEFFIEHVENILGW